MEAMRLDLGFSSHSHFMCAELAQHGYERYVASELLGAMGTG